MNQSTIIGLSGGLLLLIGMMVMSPDNIGAFLNIPGLIVVLGGTLTATFVSRPIKEVMEVLRGLRELFRDQPSTLERDIQQLLLFARHYRYHKLRLAESGLTSINNHFLRSSLEKLVGGDSYKELRNAMQWRISGMRSNEQGKIQVINTMAVFAPAFGMLGTLFGLVHMLSGLGNSGLSEIGGSMAFAMITTVYGIIASNLFFKPLAIKQERRLAQQLIQMNVLMEGILQIHQQRHPTLIRETLEAIYTHHEMGISLPSQLALVKEG